MRLSQTQSALVTAASATLVALVLLWFPSGLGIMPVIEEWGTLGIFTRNGGPIYIVGPDFYWAHRLRPLTIAPHALAYQLSPDSFVFWHVLNAASLFTKAVAMATIVFWLLRVTPLAVIGGILFILYPADTMQMSFRGIHINWAVALSVLGISIFIWSTEYRRTAAIGLAALGAAVFAVGVLTYEGGIFLSVAPLLLWFARYGVRDGIAKMRRHLSEAAIWLVIVGILAARFIIISRSPDVYQASVAANLGETLGLLVTRFPMLFTVGMYRTFFHGWYDGLRMLAANMSLIWPVILIGGAGFLAYVGVATRKRSFPAFSLSRYLLVSVALVALGYLPYLSALSHILITQRTYLFSAMGGTLAFVAIIAAILMNSRPVGIIFALLLVLSGAGNQWEQMRHYADLSARQREVLAGILGALPDPKPGAQIFISDESGALNNDWFLRGVLLTDALTYLYGHAVDATVCQSPSMIWASFSADSRGVPGKCRDDGEAWMIGVGLPAEHKLEKASTVALTLTPEGKVLGPSGSVTPATKQQVKRWKSILRCWPVTTCAYGGRSVGTESFTYDFGKYWSLEEAPWGSGWRDAQWAPPALQPLSYSWMIAPESRLWFELQPSQVAYKVDIVLGPLLGEKFLADARVLINSHPVAMTWTGNLGTGEVARAWLNKGLNSIVFQSDIQPDWGVGLAVDKVSIGPK